MKTLLCSVSGFLALMSALACSPKEAHGPDLPKQPDRWVSSINLDSTTKVEHIGKTRDYVVTTATGAKQVSGLRTIAVGDTIDGIQIGAIRCSFFWRDASYGGQQYMLRGRWGCEAGRTRDEVERAVTDNGDKLFDYLHASPVREEALGPAA